MRVTTWIACGWLLCLAAPARSGADYTGSWAYQALNAGDTSFKVQQDGDRLTLYRVLYPEFEGKRYKLEHMYRGRIQGDKIEGKLFVREEGMRDFEFLRPFAGSIERDDRMLVDDMPLKRMGGAQAAPDRSEQPPARKYERVIIKRDRDRVAQAPKKTMTGKTAEVAEAAPPSIPKLIPVAGRIKTAKGRKVDALLRKGDRFFEDKRYPESMEYFEAALKLDEHKVEVLYKLGLGHGILGSLAARKGRKAEAVSHYRKAVQFWQRAIRYDPYNWGAKENIRRAEAKLAKLE